jgi:glycerophosphoryl diester phosphodiesterase
MSSVFGTRTAVLGHRGCGKGVIGGYDENTLGSFLLAVELGVDWLEVDVRRTADDALIVAHHPTAADGRFWADLTGTQARHSGVLGLAELLDAVPSHVGINFDLKSSMEDALRDRDATTAALLAPVAAREARRRPTLVTSFDAAALTIVRELAPAVPRGILTWITFPIGQAVAAAGHLDVQVLAAQWKSLRPNDVEDETMHRPLDYTVDLVHRSGCEFLVWCPPVTFSRLLQDAGADALCVNDVPAFLDAMLEGAH